MHPGGDSALTSRQRLLTALECGTPDRLPVTTHHLMDWFLEQTMGGMDAAAFFDRFGLDRVHWVTAHQCRENKGEMIDPDWTPSGLAAPHLCSDSWRITRKPYPSGNLSTTHYTFTTPAGTLSMVLRSDPKTAWVVEPLLKHKSDIDRFARYAPVPLCDCKEVNVQARDLGDRGIVRGSIPGFDVYGQPGCWQDGAVLFGTERFILETYDDPGWVHDFLNILCERKIEFIRSMKGAGFDIVELGGGDGSSTVISPRLFSEFVAPYDSRLIDESHGLDQRIVYHICGGMMPLLDNLIEMQPDALETFTPVSMGGDVDLCEAKARIGRKLCMIGGFDQFHHLVGCPPEQTREAVRRCFHEAGSGGGYILAPSDHFFEADIGCLNALGEEARLCTYST